MYEIFTRQLYFSPPKPPLIPTETSTHTHRNLHSYPPKPPFQPTETSILEGVVSVLGVEGAKRHATRDTQHSTIKILAAFAARMCTILKPGQDRPGSITTPKDLGPLGTISAPPTSLKATIWAWDGPLAHRAGH